MTRSSRRIRNQKDNEHLENTDSQNFNGSKSKSANKRGSKVRDAESTQSPLNSPKAKNPKLVDQSLQTDKSLENQNANANKSIEITDSDLPIGDVRKVIQESSIVQAASRSRPEPQPRQSQVDEAIQELLVDNPTDDEIDKELNEGKSEARVKSKSRATTTPKSAKRSRVETNNNVTAMNQSLAEQMEKLTKELAAVKEQLKEKEAKQNESSRKDERTGITPHKANSESTIYVPAVRNIDDVIPNGVIGNRIDKSRINSRRNSPANIASVPNAVEIDRIKERENVTSLVEGQITNYLNNFRIGDRNREDQNRDRGAHRRLDFGESGQQHRETDEERNRRLARERIVEAEKYKAEIEIPKGKEIYITRDDANEIMRKLSDEDDEFLHITCHVDQAIIDKVENKQFVNLDPFLPKIDAHNYQDEQKLDMVNRGGQVFWIPHTNRKQKVNNLQTWDQAFRAYMAIYTKKFPHEAAEMAQYVHTIHHAASKYTWDNVAYYDYTFRKNMEKHPHRSWAKTFVHMWNIALCDPIKHQLPGANASMKNQTNKICWRFNKGHCPYGDKCKFPHKCSFCLGTSHGSSTCFKKNGKKNDKNKRTGGNTTNTGAAETVQGLLQETAQQ